MFTLLKIVQALIRALNSDGTPRQVAAGIALGSGLGLTPLVSLHNLVVVAAIALLNVSVPGALLGWLLAVPVGFALDPVFDAVGRALLLSVPALEPVWAWTGGTPVVALARLNNSVVLGSLVGWLVAALPIYLLARAGVVRYRSAIYPRLAESRLVRAVTASRLYNLYRLVRS